MKPIAYGQTGTPANFRRGTLPLFLNGLLICFVCIAALFAQPAAAARAYFDGNYVWSSTNCPVSGTPVEVLKTNTGYFTDPNEPYPKTGDLAYVRAVGNNISPCVNDAFGPEFFLPDGASLAISATNPVYCYLGVIGGSWSDVTATKCTQAPQSLTNYGGYFFGWSALPPGWFFEVRVPVVFNKQLLGLAGPSSHRLTVAASSAYPPYTLLPYQPVTVFYQAAFQGFGSSAITANSANLAFSLLSYYHAGSLYIDYGTTNPPPSSSSSSAVPATGASYSITSNLTSLSPSTTYYWRARFVTSDGTFTSTPVQSFTTSGVSGPQTLTVSKAGTGAGTVTSNPAGINCGATCSASFAFGSGVILSAAPTAGSMFTGWSGGGCSGTGTCTVTMSSAQSVTANLMRQIGSLSVTLGGLPASSTALLAITGPDAYSTTHSTLTGTGFNLSDVPTGTYTVTPPNVIISGRTYTAPPQSAVVNFGTTATINVTYRVKAGDLTPILMLLLD